MTSPRPTYSTFDPPYAALALCLGASMRPTTVDERGLIRFEFDGPEVVDLEERLARGGLLVDARDFIGRLTGVNRMVVANRRSRGVQGGRS